MSETPIFDSAYSECLDDAGAITRLEPLYAAFQKLERIAHIAEMEHYDWMTKERDQWRECAIELARRLRIESSGHMSGPATSTKAALRRFDELEKGNS